MNKGGSDIRFFTDLEAWKQNHVLVKEIYLVTKKFPPDERFGLTDQMRRSASSICANIAEGYGRYHTKDKMRFYYQARGSSTETINHLILAHELDYLSTKEYDHLKNLAYTGYKILCGLTRSFQK